MREVRGGLSQRVARLDNAKSTLARLEPLLPKHAVAQQDVDNAHVGARVGAGGDGRGEEGPRRHRHSRRDLRAGRTRADRARRARDRAGRPPHDDRRARSGVRDVPSVVAADARVAAGSAARARSFAEVGQNGAVDGRVRVVLPDGALLPRVGRLNFVSPSLDSASGTQEFRAQVRQRRSRLLPGQFVRVRLDGFARANALAVPQRAVQQGLGRQYVYVVGAGDTVVARDVKPGPWSGTLWIIDDGLSAGDRVVVDGIQKVAPGRVVKPVPVVDSSAVQWTAEAGARATERRPPTPRSSTSSSAARSWRGDLDRHHAARLVRDSAAADRALSADHAAGGAHHGELSRRVVRGRRAGRRRADRRAARRAFKECSTTRPSNASDGTTNITMTFDVSRNQDLAAVDVQNAVKLAEPQLPDAVRTNGITILKANTDILGVVALQLERSALRRDVSRELPQALRRRRAEARARRGRRDAVSRARLLDAAPARPGEDGAARHHGRATSPPRCASRTRRIPPAAWAPSRRRRARSSRCRSRRSAGLTDAARSSTTSSCARGPTDRSCACRDIGNATLGARSYDLEGRLNGAPTAFVLLYTRPGRQRARGEGRGARREWTSCRRRFPQGVTLRDSVRHDAVRHRVDQGSGDHARRGDDPRDARRVPLSAELARDADPDARRAGERDRHVPRTAACSGCRSTCSRCSGSCWRSASWWTTRSS